MKLINAIFPGTFDPIHKGHLDIIKRTSKLFNKIYIVVSINIYKKDAAKLEKRYQDVAKQVKKLKLKNVFVIKNTGLVVNVAKKYDCKVIIRAIRNAKDALEEINIAKVNNYLAKHLETILVLPKQELINLSSTSIRFLRDTKKRFIKK